MASDLSDKTVEALAKIISDDFGTITGEVLAVFEECLKAFEYKGFDPDRIRKVLAQRQSKLRQGTVIEIKDSISIEVSGAKGLSNLVSLLMILFNLRGNNLEAILDGLEPRTKASVEAVFTTLDLKSKVMLQGKPKSSETLTLSRISAAFPLHSLSVVRNPKFVRQIIDLSDIGVNDTDLGRCMQHPVCASTMTKRMIQDGCHMVTFLAAIRLNAIIGQAQKTTTERLWAFHLATLGSKAVPETRKVAYWNNLYEPEAVRAWVDQAQKILEKDLSDKLFGLIKGYKPT
uniref:Nucleoprotein n=1 Tax=Anopheles bunya-like virus TaxID=2805757 RepID=A0A889IPK5_9VIRU|nr:MAG: nucleocapsid [Anopheles bunya-like virus]